MTFVFDLPNEQLLPAAFDVVEKIEEFISATNMSELKTAPKDGETTREAGRRNIRAMAKRACKEFPVETARVTDAMWICGENETAPNAISTFAKCVNRADVMDFFISLLSLA